MTGVQCSHYFFSFFKMEPVKGEPLVINEYMHEYTVYVLGVPDLLHILWSVTGGDVPGDQGPEMFWQKEKKKYI